MSRILLVAAGLAGIYLLVLTSVAPGDIAVGGLLGLALAVALRPADASGRARPAAVAGLLLQTGLEMVRGSWRVARFCLGVSSRPGFVEIPRGARSRSDVAVWGLLTGEAPDEVVVDVDEARDVLIVHLVDAADPEAVRARHRRTYERRQRKAVS